MTVSFATHIVTRLRAASTVDAYHNVVLDWSAPTRRDIAGCRVQPLESTEYSVDREATISRWRLMLPPGADVNALDRVEYQGDTFTVDGQVQWWESPTGALAHGEAILLRLEG